MNRKTWVEPAPISISPALREAVGGHPLIAERLARRGLIVPESARRFLSPQEYTPASFVELPDMYPAVNRLQRAIQQGERILVWGDFDVDGQTSTALLVEALRGLGANVAYHIPNRFTEGHGIHLPTLKTLLDGGVDLILTCDTGIAAHDAVDYARSRGVSVVITDHHALPPTLPLADAVVNPMRLPAGHPLRELPGVGTAYQLVRALYEKRPSDHLLDLVAVGIVADVMVLVDDTRYWLQRGLEVLRHSPRPGLRALLERAEINPTDVTESDIGFALAPRLNALGRLADANPAVELLTTDDAAVIAERVTELEGLNQQRRFLTRQVFQAAQNQIEQEPSLLKYAALVIASEDWPTGVVGIVASRLVEEYGRPALVLSLKDGVASGSARSVAGCNIVEAIRSQASLITHFGGHSMAAGLSLPAANLFDFRRGLSGVVRDALGQAALEPQLVIDAVLALNEVDLAFAEDLARLAPFGNGNPPLALMSRNLHIKNRRALGSRGDHLRLTVVDDSGAERQVIWWFGDADGLPSGTFDLAYTVRASVYNGKKEALIEWLDARPSDSAIALSSDQPRYTVIDHRETTQPQVMLQALLRQYPDALVWREGNADVDGVDRHHLQPCATLIVYTAPPSPAIWQAVLNKTQPQILILIGQPPDLITMQPLLKHLAGLLKYALRHKQGIVSRSELAALTGQTETVIEAAFDWLHKPTALSIKTLSDDMTQVTHDPGRIRVRTSGMDDRLTVLLRESAAYRRYWRQQAF